MRDELDQKLCEYYPKIFANRHADMQTTAMCWGFECGDGWFNIIDKLCSNIQLTINWRRKERLSALRYNRALKSALAGDRTKLEKYHSVNGVLTEYGARHVDDDIKRATYRTVNDKIRQVVATQVKEKFGGLRFYYEGGNEYINGLVAMAESMSYVTCEVCGNPGKTNKSGWLRTLCEAHTVEKD